MKAYFGKKRYRQIQSATHGTEIWRKSTGISPRQTGYRHDSAGTRKAVTAL